MRTLLAVVISLFLLVGVFVGKLAVKIIELYEGAENLAKGWVKKC